MDLVAVVELYGAADEGLAAGAAELVHGGSARACPGDHAYPVKTGAVGVPFQAYMVTLWHRHMWAHAPVGASGEDLRGSHDRIVGRQSYGAL